MFVRILAAAIAHPCNGDVWLAATTPLHAQSADTFGGANVPLYGSKEMDRLAQCAA